MAEENDSERLKAVERMLKEQEERHQNMVTYVIVAVIIAIIAFALWNNNRINGPDTTNTGDGTPSGGQCFIAGDC